MQRAHHPRPRQPSERIRADPGCCSTSPDQADNATPRASTRAGLANTYRLVPRPCRARQRRSRTWAARPGAHRRADRRACRADAWLLAPRPVETPEDLIALASVAFEPALGAPAPDLSAFGRGSGAEHFRPHFPSATPMERPRRPAARESRQGVRVKGPEEMTKVTSAGETFLIRTEPAGMPQSFAVASQTLTALSLAWTQLVRRDRSWHLRVPRFRDDPAGPVLHHEVAASAEEAKRGLRCFERQSSPATDLGKKAPRCRHSRCWE